MATRKTETRGRKPRVGLHSQSKAVAEKDVAWDTVDSTEEEREGDPHPFVPRHLKSDLSLMLQHLEVGCML